MKGEPAEQGIRFGLSGAEPGISGGGSRGTWLYQFKALLPTLITVYTAAVALLLALVVIRLQVGIQISYFTSDPSATVGEPSYIGLVSNVGILLWSGAAALCFFAFAVLRRRIPNEKKLSSFLLFSGLLTTLLLLDDLFLLHSNVLGSLDVPNWLILAGYLALGFLYLVRFAGTIRETEYIPLIFALGFFGLSAVIDATPGNYSGQQLAEEGAKLLGIVSWAVYLVRVSLYAADRAYGSPTWR